jgi:hypothetical protein
VCKRVDCVFAHVANPGEFWAAAGVDLVREVNTLNMVRAALAEVAEVYERASTPSLLKAGLSDRLPLYGELVRLASAAWTVTRSSGDSASPESFGRALLCEAAYRPFREATLGVMAAPFPGRESPDTRLVDAALKRSSTALADWLRATSAFDEPSPGDPLGTAARAALQTTVHDCVLASASERLAQSLPPLTCEKIGNWAMEILDSEVGDAAASSGRWRDASVVPVEFRRFAGRRSVYAKLIETLTDHAGLLVDAFRPSDGAVQNALMMPTFWSDWRTATIEEGIELGPHLWRDIVWDDLPPAVLTDVAEHLATAYQEPRPYDVVLTVSGLPPQGAFWTAGGVTWYDIALFDLGELHLLKLVGREPANDSMRVWVVTEAVSKIDAHQKALRIATPAVAAAHFGVSSDNAPGLKIAVAPVLYVGNPLTLSSNQSDNTARHLWQAPAGMLDGHVRTLSEVFGPIVSRATQSRETPIEASLVRAWSWYQAGRWQADQTVLFVAYFIAIEHIFMHDHKGGNLTSRASRLLATWAEVKHPAALYWRPVIEKARAIASEARDDAHVSTVLDGLARFGNWRTTLRPWYVPDAVETLARALGVHPMTATLQDYVHDLRALIDLDAPRIAYEQAERDRWRFVLIRLTTRRNQVVHEALLAASDTSFYAQAIGEIVERLLNRIGNVVLNAPQPDQTIEDVLDWHKTPWE